LQKLYIKNETQGGNPLANILVVIVGAFIIGVTVVLGFFAFLALSAIVLVAGTVIGVRVWWAKRKMPRAEEPTVVDDDEVIEGEFHVVKKDKTS
jgi:hypothetical protein